MQYDLLIQGHGIAGAVLAETARQRGLSVHVFDRKLPGNASMAAGGAVNPVALRRLKPVWRAVELFSVAAAFYQAWQQRTKARYWHERPLVKVFTSNEEKATWQHAMAHAELGPFLALQAEPEIDQAAFHIPFGYGTVIKAGWLDIPAMLHTQRAELLQEGKLTEEEVPAEAIVEEANGVRVNGVRGRWLVRCLGAFEQMPGISPLKGESLTVRLTNLQLTRMVRSRIALIPLGEGVFRVGATHAHEGIWQGPSEPASQWLLSGLQELLDTAAVPLQAHVGVRPGSRDKRPIIGRVGKRQAVLNGLGGHGALYAPWCAHHLLGYLFDGQLLDPQVDAARMGA